MYCLYYKEGREIFKGFKKEKRKYSKCKLIS